MWNAKKLTWVFTFQGTDCSNADITVGCKTLPFDQLGEATSRYVAGTNNVVNHLARAGPRDAAQGSSQSEAATRDARGAALGRA